MTLVPVQSRQNTFFKQVRQWRRMGSTSPTIQVEGHKLCHEAERAGAQRLQRWMTDPCDEVGDGSRQFLIDQSMLAQLSTLKSALSPIDIYQRPAWSEAREIAAKTDRFLLLDNIQEPGNMGAIIRAAVAFGVEALFRLGGADPFHPASIRASAGAVLFARIASIGEGDLAEIDAEFVAADMQGPNRLESFQWPARAVLVLGNEGHGPSQAILDRVDARISIPISSKVESLNVMGAAHILLSSWTQSLRGSETS